MGKNKNKKIEKFSKNHMYHKKNYKKLLFFLALPWFYYLRSTSNKPEDRHTKNYETFVEFKLVPTTSMSQVESFCVFFSFFLTLPNIREKKLKKYENQHFIKKKTLARKKKQLPANMQQTKWKSHWNNRKQAKKTEKIKHETGWHEISACKPIPCESRKNEK